MSSIEFDLEIFLPRTSSIQVPAKKDIVFHSFRSTAAEILHLTHALNKTLAMATNNFNTYHNLSAKIRYHFEEITSTITFKVHKDQQQHVPSTRLL